MLYTKNSLSHTFSSLDHYYCAVSSSNRFLESCECLCVHPAILHFCVLLLRSTVHEAYFLFLELRQLRMPLYASSFSYYPCVLLLCSTVHVVRRFPVSSNPFKLRMPLYASSLFSFRVSLLLSGRVLWRVANYLLTDTKHGQSTGLCSVINRNLATSLSVLRRTTKAGVVC